MIPMTTGTWLTSPTRPPHQLCNQWLSFHLSFYLLITALKSSLTKSQRFVSFLFVKNLQESSDIPLHVLLCHVFPTCISQICLFILFFFSRQIIHSHITVLFTPPSTFPNWSSLMTSRLKISFSLVCFTPKGIYQRYTSNALCGSTCLNEYVREEYPTTTALNMDKFSSLCYE